MQLREWLLWLPTPGKHRYNVNLLKRILRYLRLYCQLCDEDGGKVFFFWSCKVYWWPPNFLRCWYTFSLTQSDFQQRSSGKSCNILFPRLFCCATVKSWQSGKSMSDCSLKEVLAYHDYCFLLVGRAAYFCKIIIIRNYQRHYLQKLRLY